MTAPEHEKIPKKLIVATAVYGILLLAVVLIANLTKIDNWFVGVMMLLRPILWGLVLAYLLNPVFRFYERKLFGKIRHMSLRRTFALILAYLTLLLVIILFVALIIPQLFSSIAGFLTNFEGYMDVAIAQLNNLIIGFNDFLVGMGFEQSKIPLIQPDGVNFSVIYLNMDKILEWVQGFFGVDNAFSMEVLIGTIGGIFGVIADALFAFFISLYFLSSKEKRYAQVMKFRRALFNDKTNAAITRLCTVADKSFGGFIEGKLLDAVIVALLTYVVTAIFGIPYALLIAVFIGIANIIPLVGFVIGLIPTALIVLLTDPGKIIPFLIIMILIQQLDSNIITPKILGNSTGISSLCILIAITTVGALWGFTGMLLAVPIFATVIELTTGHMEARLRAKGLPSTTENYYPADSMVDPATDVRSSTDKIIKTIERKYLRICKKQERGEELTRAERAHVTFYSFCRRLHIIPEMSDELLTQFSTEEAIEKAAAETERLIKEDRGTDLLEQ